MDGLHAKWKGTDSESDPCHTDDSAMQATHSPDNKNSPPDGGYGWVCATAAAVINGHSWGFNSAYAVFLAYYLDNNIFLGSTPMQYAFVGGLSLTSLLLVSPIATISSRKIGIRRTMFLGVLLETASLLLASLASKLWHLFLTQGLIFGAGVGLLFIPTAAVVPQWFTSKRSLASGVSLSGAGLGGAIYSLVASVMISTLGLQWAFRILGILAFVVNSSCIFLIRDRTKAVQVNQRAFEITLFKRVDYMLLIGFSGFTMLGYFVLIFSLADYATTIRLNQAQGSLVSALFNFGQAVGRPLVGYFSDSVGRMNIAGAMTLLASVLAIVLWVNSKSYGVLIFFAASEGLVAGNFWATIAPLMTEVVGAQDAWSGLNLMWLSMVLPSTFSAPIALAIASGTGSYLGAQLFTGFAYLAAALCMGLLRGLKLALEDQRTKSQPNTEIRQSLGPNASSQAAGRGVTFRAQTLAYLRYCGRWAKI